MKRKGDALNALARHLHDAIERVRLDVAKVEFWADAMTEFSQPAPEYESSDVKIWLPTEQATTLTSARKNETSARKQSRRSRVRLI